ncbi:MAG: winged helix-turn-helix domain-containing protein [Gemmataceae bacterium]|nr:winged helix-turn-helix domain-containing protein [Gemmataceae bacterium]
MHVEAHHTAAELAARIRSESRAKVVRRLTAVRLALLGHRPEDIATQVVLSARQVRTWVARYNAAGPDGLADAAGRGRKSPLDADARTRLADRLRAGPTPADGVCTLRGEDIRRILKAEFGLVRSLSAVYHLLHALGFEPLRPRPRHPRASAEAQAAFQKSCPPGSPRPRRPAPGSGSRCGSRTRPGSARRVP